jgi:flagellar biosynthesis protein FlhG
MRCEDGVDQAEGLRRLLDLSQTRVVTVVAAKARAGRTSATINLAAALASTGKGVLVLDENHGPNNLLDCMGLSARHDLLDYAQGKCGLSQAVQSCMGFGILPTARALHVLTRLGQANQKRLENAMIEAADGADVVLVDAAMQVVSPEQKFAAVSPSLASGAALMILVEATPSGITDSYALIKRLAEKTLHQQFGIAVNKASNEAAAHNVYENMAKVARRNLSVRLEYLGQIPVDTRLQHAKAGIRDASLSASFNAYIKLSQKLLRLPMQQDDEQNGTQSVIQNLMRHAFGPIALMQ